MDYEKEIEALSKEVKEAEQVWYDLRARRDALLLEQATAKFEADGIKPPCVVSVYSTPWGAKEPKYRGDAWFQKVGFAYGRAEPVLKKVKRDGTASMVNFVALGGAMTLRKPEGR